MDGQGSEHTPPNVAIWQIDNFELKELEKWQVCEGPSILPLEQATDPPAGGALAAPRGKEPHLWKDREESERRVRAEFAQLTAPSPRPLSGDFPLRQTRPEKVQVHPLSDVAS